MDRTEFFASLFHVATTNIKRDIKEIRNLHINPKNQLHNYIHKSVQMFLELRQIGESPWISWKCDVMSRQVSGMT